MPCATHCENKKLNHPYVRFGRSKGVCDTASYLYDYLLDKGMMRGVTTLEINQDFHESFKDISEARQELDSECDTEVACFSIRGPRTPEGLPSVCGRWVLIDEASERDAVTECHSMFVASVAAEQHSQRKTA